MDGDGGSGVERVVGEYGSVDGITRGVKINRGGNGIGRIVRGPDIVAGGGGGVALAEEEGFEAQGIEQDIEGSSGDAVEAGVKVGRGVEIRDPNMMRSE